jgi:hypothetical protein
LGLVIILAFNTNIVTILVFCISNFLCLLLGNDNNLCGTLDFMLCVEYIMFKEFGLWFPPYKIDFKTKFLVLMATILIDN